MTITVTDVEMPTGDANNRGWLYSVSLVSAGYNDCDQGLSNLVKNANWPSDWGVGTEEDDTLSQYEIAVGYDEFDISSIPQTAIITDARISAKLKGVQDNGGSFVLEAYERYYSTLQTGDWMRGSSVQSISDGGKRAASIASGDWTTSKYYDLDNVNLVDLLQYRVSLATSLWQIIITTNKHRNVSTPNTNTGRAFATSKVANDPFRLYVSYRVPDGPEALTLGVAL